jgi:hypothetical protein
MQESNSIPKCGHVSDVAEQFVTLGLAFRTNPTKKIIASGESSSIQAISRHGATLITRIDSLQDRGDEVKVALVLCVTA